MRLITIRAPAGVGIGNYFYDHEGTKMPPLAIPGIQVPGPVPGAKTF